MRSALILSGVILTIFLVPTVVYGMEDAIYVGQAPMYVEDYKYYENYEIEYESVYEDEYEEENDYEEELPTILITTYPLNLRSTPCTTRTRIALAPRGSKIEVLDRRCGEWFYVRFNGMTGYMYAEFLAELPAHGSATFVPGQVEMLEWSEARRVMTIGTPATIIDLRTGITYQVASFSNGNHADVETITAEDTARMLEAFGGRWCWTPRPVLVLINGRSLVASINGMPHAGSTNFSNNMNGHVCLHFLNSPHFGNQQHGRDHQNAVREAYRLATQR